MPSADIDLISVLDGHDASPEIQPILHDLKLQPDGTHDAATVPAVSAKAGAGAGGDGAGAEGDGVDSASPVGDKHEWSFCKSVARKHFSRVTRHLDGQSLFHIATVQYFKTSEMVYLVRLKTPRAALAACDIALIRQGKGALNGTTGRERKAALAEFQSMRSTAMQKVSPLRKYLLGLGPEPTSASQAKSTRRSSSLTKADTKAASQDGHAAPPKVLTKLQDLKLQATTKSEQVTSSSVDSTSDGKSDTPSAAERQTLSFCRQMAKQNCSLITNKFDGIVEAFSAFVRYFKTSEMVYLARCYTPRAALAVCDIGLMQQGKGPLNGTTEVERAQEMSRLRRLLSTAPTEWKPLRKYLLGLGPDPRGGSPAKRTRNASPRSDATGQKPFRSVSGGRHESGPEAMESEKPSPAPAQTGDALAGDGSGGIGSRTRAQSPTFAFCRSVAKQNFSYLKRRYEGSAQFYEASVKFFETSTDVYLARFKTPRAALAACDVALLRQGKGALNGTTEQERETALTEVSSLLKKPLKPERAYLLFGRKGPGAVSQTSATAELRGTAGKAADAVRFPASQRRFVGIERVVADGATQWVAHINLPQGRKLCLGSFSRAEYAGAAYDAACVVLGKRTPNMTSDEDQVAARTEAIASSEADEEALQLLGWTFSLSMPSDPREPTSSSVPPDGAGAEGKSSAARRRPEKTFGVAKQTQAGKVTFVARISTGGRVLQLGHYGDRDTACAVYDAAAELLLDGPRNGTSECERAHARRVAVSSGGLDKFTLSLLGWSIEQSKPATRQLTPRRTLKAPSEKFVGVHMASEGRWVAEMELEQRRGCLGEFFDEGLAAAACDAASITLGIRPKNNTSDEQRRVAREVAVESDAADAWLMDVLSWSDERAKKPTGRSSKTEAIHTTSSSSNERVAVSVDGSVAARKVAVSDDTTNKDAHKLASQIESDVPHVGKAATSQAKTPAPRSSRSSKAGARKRRRATRVSGTAKRTRAAAALPDPRATTLAATSGSDGSSDSDYGSQLIYCEMDAKEYMQWNAAARLAEAADDEADSGDIASVASSTVVASTSASAADTGDAICGKSSVRADRVASLAEAASSFAGSLSVTSGGSESSFAPSGDELSPDSSEAAVDETIDADQDSIWSPLGTPWIREMKGVRRLQPEGQTRTAPSNRQSPRDSFVASSAASGDPPESGLPRRIDLSDTHVDGLRDKAVTPANGSTSDVTAARLSVPTETPERSEAPSSDSELFAAPSTDGGGMSPSYSTICLSPQRSPPPAGASSPIVDCVAALAQRDAVATHVSGESTAVARDRMGDDAADAPVSRLDASLTNYGDSANPRKDRRAPQQTPGTAEGNTPNYPVLYSRLLLHASTCTAADCRSTSCYTIRALLRHAVSCEVRTTGGCDVCKRVWALLSIHARECRARPRECPVLHCTSLKRSRSNAMLPGQTARSRDSAGSSRCESVAGRAQLAVRGVWRDARGATSSPTTAGRGAAASLPGDAPAGRVDLGDVATRDRVAPLASLLPRRTSPAVTSDEGSSGSDSDMSLESSFAAVAESPAPRSLRSSAPPSAAPVPLVAAVETFSAATSRRSPSEEPPLLHSLRAPRETPDVVDLTTPHAPFPHAAGVGARRVEVVDLTVDSISSAGAQSDYPSARDSGSGVIDLVAPSSADSFVRESHRRRRP